MHETDKETEKLLAATYQWKPPLAELVLYGLTYVATIFYFCFLVFANYYIDYRSVNPPVRKSWFGFYEDVSLEAFRLFSDNIGLILLCNTFNIVVSRTARYCCSSTVYHVICGCVTLATSSWMLSSSNAALSMLISYMVAFAVTYLTSSLIMSWIVVSIYFSFLSSHYCFTEFAPNILKLQPGMIEFYYGIIGYLICRYLSFSHYLWQQKNNISLLEHAALTFHYSFYWPYFLSGPTLTYKDFAAQTFNTSWEDIKSFLWRGVRLLFWYYFSHGLLHFLHCNHFILTELHSETHYGVAAFCIYFRGQFFMLEYVVYYGVGILFARLDGVVLYDWPDCISHVMTYRDMWRVFDRGLFAIIRDHVYIPLGGSRHGLARQLLATVAGFAFICLYHGTYWSIKVWIFLNCLQVILEVLVEKLYFAYLQHKLVQFIGNGMERRLIAFIIGVNLLWCSVFIFYFIYPPPIGYNLIHLFFLKPLFYDGKVCNLILLTYIFYSTVQLMKYCTKSSQRRRIKK